MTERQAERESNREKWHEKMHCFLIHIPDSEAWNSTDPKLVVI